MSAPFKVAIIGAGSVGFTKTLISDLLKVPEFAGVEFALTDINQHNLSMICLAMSRLAGLRSVRANSQFANSGTLSRSEISVLVKPIEPAPMTVTLNDMGFLQDSPTGRMR